MQELVAKGQVTITTLKDAYHVSQSIGEYIFPALSNGTVASAVTVVSAIQVTQGDTNYTGFTIGAISKPPGFDSITINNSKKTVTYSVAANTTNLAEHGSLIVPVLIEGITYNLSFQWAKAKDGSTGGSGKDGYTIKSSRQGCTIATDMNGNVQTSIVTSTVISALRGTTVVSPVVGVLPAVTGCSLSKSGTTVTFTFLTGTLLVDQGVIDIPVTVDGIAFTVSFSYAKARAGSTGKPGIDANLLDWVNDWNTGKTLINNSTVITPKIFAGVKNSDGTLTGTVLGHFVLSSKNTSGSIINETIDGLYGFRDGYKTFFIDNSGNAQLGRGEQFIKYNATTGKVEFGAGVSLHWAGATYIDKDGVFTGILSAGIVNAFQLNASQITSGTISADRIDVNALKASLITAENIESLTLNVIKGKIGSWIIDGDSIYRGSKDNVSSTYTGASGSVTLGSNGLRGFKWRLEATGGGSLAGGNIAWDNSGNVTFGSSVTLLWNTPINSITTALGGTGYPKMTKITAEGIYTGGITASQITAGTISADRIAAGSINATKLDAASIKSSIINTSYINGLSCTFVQGKIGGWTIGSTALTNTHISLDNGNKRIVVYGANSGVTSGQRVQLYYNNDSDFGFYATDASGNCIARLGSSNQIAGWGFDTTQIHKNNVYLNSDGSIVNGTKWRLNNDGSGQIANAAITWDSTGKVSFSSAVSLNWTSAIDAVQIGGSNLLNNSGEWREAGWNGGYTSNGGGYTIDSSITFNGKPTLKTDVGTGLVHSAWIKLENNVEYTYSAMVRCNKSISGNGNTPLHYWSGLDNQNQGKLTVIKYDTTVTANVWKRIYVTFKLNGDGNSFRPFFYRGSNESTFYQIAYFKLERGNKPTDWSQSVSDANKLSSNAQNTANAVVNALGGSNYPKLTKIDSTGVYTGTLVASQITAGTISADRIAANSLNGNKIISRSITADRIVSQAITANEIASRTITAANIKASAITAYEIAGSTITAAEIASRTITAAKIQASAITAYEIAGNTITAAEIASRTITAAKIATGTITANEINVSSIQAAVVTAGAVNGLTCSFTQGTIGGFEIYGHKILARESDNGAGISHYIEIHKTGYICNARNSDNKDFWALHRNGSAEFGLGKIFFGANGDGWLANKNITWDTNGNVSMTGTISATAGYIGNFNISGGKLVNKTTTASIEFSGLSGSSLYLNSGSSLISIRSDVNKTGISIQTYSAGARGISIIANAGSVYAIESYGPMQLGQRSGERWCVPGVLYVGCKYSTGYNNYYRKIWGDGASISSFSHIGDGKYRVYHNLGHTDYTVMAILWSSTTYYGFFRLLERTSSYFVIQNIGAGGKPDAGAFDFIIMGRNAW